MARLPHLSSRVMEELDEMPERPFLSVISLLEVSLLVAVGAVALDPSPEEWIRTASHPAAIRLAQLTREVALELLKLPKSFQRDPADRIIVATARALNIPVLTRDKQIRNSGLVKLWSAK